ncbi:amidase [Aquabacterium sp. J223]|uniref:amidase n=1 Tax=Aquabacterium sp. J223 TaxID=2898431 RepID=UPI0021ADBCB5|nr:amidase [Aquabacterium sp. J223]UUX96320.1 amidase [Aquabacterium sp. J223]
MTTLHEQSATVLVSLYRNRAASPVEVTRSVLAHIGHWEPLLNATYALDPEAAMAMARASEQRWHHGEPLGPLDGVPVTIKENIATAGVPVPLGSAATTLQPAIADAPPAARLREGGAVLLGKTTMPDLGMLSSGLSSFHPLTRNPWDLAKNPGGSSAGAAAACAAGYGPLHLGTDIGGSIRLPAGWCGVVGFKPSLGRVPIQPPYAGRVAGPITRTVADAALLMGVLSQPDWRDATALPAQATAWSALERPLKGLRVGLWLDAGWGLALEAQTEAVVRRAAERLEGEGAIVEPLGPFTTRAMVDGLDRFWRMRAWLDLQALPAGRRHRVLPYIRDWAAPAQGYSGAQVFEGFSQMAAIRDATVAATQGFDVVLSPVSPVLPFAAEAASPLDDPARPFEHIAYTLPFNFSEQPAIALPAGWSADGLPIGLQIAGRRHDDLGVLQVAHALERLTPRRAWPTAPLDG